MRGLFLMCLSLFGVLSFVTVPVFAQEDEEVAKLLQALTEVDDVEGDEVVVEEPTAEEDHNAASDILDDIEDDKWAWSAAEDIRVDSTTETSAMIMTTQITYDGTPVERYKIYYSDRTLATFQDYDQIQDVVVTPERTEGTMVYLNLDVLSSEATYYVVVAPVHPTDPTIEPLTMISDEVTFTTQRRAVSGNAKVFNNVSYTYTDGSVTLTWTPSDDAVDAEIHLRHQSEGVYTKIGSPLMKDGSFNFSVDKSGNYFLKMVALNGEGQSVGKEHIQTVKIEEVVAPNPEKPVEVAPSVGPATDMIVGLLAFAFVMYFVYRFRRIER